VQEKAPIGITDSSRRFFFVWRLRSWGMAPLLIVALLWMAATVHAQLAVTEMMSAALKTNPITGQIATNNSDYWEVTNFGTNTIDISHYYYTDNKHPLFPLVQFSDGPLFIRPAESVVFVRNNVTTNEAMFRAWWGSCVGPDVQIRFFPEPGFSSQGDSILLYDANFRLVDGIEFAWGLRGRSFVYDPETGAFGKFSALGEGVACRSETAEDIGSPGSTTGPVPMRIVEQPGSVVACLGLDTILTVSAVGMPRPRYQWYFNGTAIPNANRPGLTLSNVSFASTGVYWVVITNGLTVVQSSNAVVSIDTTPSPPLIIAPPVDATVVTNRTARFSVAACAFPAARYQWLSNGVALANATNRTLLVPNCTFAMSGSEFCVRIQNSTGITNVCARLYVTPKPELRITEVQSWAYTNCNAHHDWFELTNFGTNTVNLLGWRFFDTFKLTNALVVTQAIFLRPYESVVFSKDMTPDIFIEWWGVDQLPPGLKIYPYQGFSLSKDGDKLYIWSNSAEVREEAIDGVSFAAMSQGVSLHFDTNECFFGCNSVAAEAGAFLSQQCGDLGSPGYTINPPPRLVSITRDQDGATVKWRAVPGKTYELEFNPDVSGYIGGWNSLGTITAVSTLPTMQDASAINSSQRFYRVREMTP
jgi:hypothetical protein